MASDPFDDVLNLEDRFFAEGYRQGTEDGIKAGKVEGRSVGLAKGYEKFFESGKVHGRSVVWANRLSLPQKTNANANAMGPSSSSPSVSSSKQQKQQQQQQQQQKQQQEEGEVEKGEKEKTCSLPPLAPNARLEKNVMAAFALVEPDTLSKENSDDAVNDFDDRLKRALGKVKIVERMTGEGSAAKGAAATEPGLTTTNLEATQA